MKDIKIYKIVEYQGCEMEDGSNTTTKRVSFQVIDCRERYTENVEFPEKIPNEEDKFLERMADMSGYQDYSYKINYECVLELDWDELKHFKDAIMNSEVINEILKLVGDLK